MSYNLEELKQQIVQHQEKFEIEKNKYIELYARTEVAKKELEIVKNIEKELMAEIPAIKPNVEQIRTICRSAAEQETQRSMEEIKKLLSMTDELIKAKDIEELTHQPYEFNSKSSDLKNNKLEIKNLDHKIIQIDIENQKKIIEIAEIAVKINKRNDELNKLKLETAKKKELIKQSKEKEQIEASKSRIESNEIITFLNSSTLKSEPVSPTQLDINTQTTVLMMSPSSTHSLLDTQSITSATRQSLLDAQSISSDTQQILPASIPQQKALLPIVDQSRLRATATADDVVCISDESIIETEIDRMVIDVTAPDDNFEFNFEPIPSQFGVTKPKIPKLTHQENVTNNISNNMFDLDTNVFNLNPNQEPTNNFFDFEF